MKAPVFDRPGTAPDSFELCRGEKICGETTVSSLFSGMRISRFLARTKRWGLVFLSLIVAVACNSDDVTPDVVPEITLSLTPERLTFDPDAGAGNAIRVATNAAWRARASEPELLFEPASGVGDGTIIVTGIPAGRTCTLAVVAGEGSNAVTRTAVITRPEEDDPDPEPDPNTGEIVFSLDFGASMGSDSKFADAFDDWKTQTGTGAAGVSYESFGVKIRSGYDGSSAGASGMGYATMTATRSSNCFVIRNIALPAGITDFTLSFFTTCATGDLKLKVGSAAATAELNHTAAASYNVWTRVEVGFSLKSSMEKIDLSFAPSRDFDYDDRRYGLNFDDIVLVAGGGGQIVDLGASPTPVDTYRFPELPADWVAPTGEAAAREGDRAFYTHWSKSVKTKKIVRNYSYCYDTRRHNPVWVAYPLHAVYREGGTGRTNPDPWTPDPMLDETLQSKIYKSAGDGDGIYDGYQFWGNTLLASLGKGGYWSKGHLCMSSERGGADSELNKQTFYPTNIAPQSSAAASDFATVWSYVETLFSGTNDYKNTDFTADDGAQNINIVADTLYLVAGCYYEHDDWKDYDAANYDYSPATSSASKLCVMPTHQFKMALRTKKGNTGKKIAECTADELQAIGFWIEAFPTVVSSSAAAQLKEIAVPVSFIEQKTGIEFFPGVPASVKESFDASDWGF